MVSLILLLLIDSFLLHLFRLSFNEKVSDTSVDLFQESVEQDDHIKSDVHSDEVKECVGQVMPLNRVAHILCEKKHEPYANENDRLVDDLDGIVDFVVHGAYNDVENEQTRAQNVCQEDL